MFVGNCGSGTFYAIDRATGEPRWTYEATRDGGQAFHGSAVVHRDLVLVGSDGTVGHVYAFRAATGDLLWKRHAGKGGSYFDLIVAKERVIAVTAADGVLALDVRTGAEVWKSPLRPGRYGSPATDGTYVFVADADGTLHALDAATGKRRWSLRLGAEPSNTPRLTGSAIVIGTSKTSWDQPWSTGSPDAHHLYRVSATTGKVLGKVSLPAKALGPPVVIGDMLVVYSGNDLVGVDARMRVLWKRTARHQSHIPRVQVWKGAVIAPSDPKDIVIVDPKTGAVLSRHDAGAGVTTLRATEEALYAGVVGGELHAYRLSRRRER